MVSVSTLAGSELRYYLEGSHLFRADFDKDYSQTFSIALEFFFRLDSGFLAISDKLLKIGSQPWHVKIAHTLSYGDVYVARRKILDGIPVNHELFLEYGAPPSWTALWRPCLDLFTIHEASLLSVVNPELATNRVETACLYCAVYLLYHIYTRLHYFSGDYAALKDYPNLIKNLISTYPQFEYIAPDNRLVIGLIFSDQILSLLKIEELIKKCPKYFKPVSFQELMVFKDFDLGLYYGVCREFLPAFVASF